MDMTPLTMKERFQKYAATKSEGTRIYNILVRTLYADATGDIDGALKANLPELNFLFFMKGCKGIGRRAMHVIADVAADILGE